MGLPFSYNRIPSCLFFTFIIFLIGVSLLPETMYYRYTREDGIVENMSVLSCFLAAYFCFKGFLIRRRIFSKQHWVLLFFMTLFLFVGLEEISWGQRMIGIRPIMEIGVGTNYQAEINIHNLQNLDFFFYFGGFAFIVSFSGILPILTYRSKRIRDLCLRFGVPLMPGLFCLTMWLGFILLVLIPQGQFDSRIFFRVRLETLYAAREIRELYFSFVLCSYFFVDYFHLLKHRSPYGVQSNIEKTNE